MVLFIVINKFIDMHGINYDRTQTYLSTFSHQSDYETKDKTLHKAIKQNNAQIILPKELEAHTESAVLFDEEKQLSTAIIDLRKRYDMVKIQTNQTQKNIQRMEEEKLRIQVSRQQMLRRIDEAKGSYQAMLELIKDGETMIQYGEYQHAVRLNMKDVLKHDILHTKKQCFDSNVKLIRTSTALRELQQKNTNRKHIKSKCKLVLNSLQQTVQSRETQRHAHLDQVEQILRKKLQNNDMKNSRQQFLEDALYRALNDRLPEEKYLLGKWKCEVFLKEMLRSKMKRIIDKYHEVQLAFSAVKKSTNVKTTTQFIEQFLNKEERYGQLLGTIEKAEVKIKLEKENRALLQKQHQQLEYQTYQLQKMMKPSLGNKEQHPELTSRLEKYSDEVIKSQKLEINLRKWATTTWMRLQMINNQDVSQNYLDYVKQLEGVSLKKIITKNLNSLLEVHNQREAEEKKQEIKRSVTPVTPEKQSELTTERTGGKLTLRELTGESTLSKEYSRRNFRVKTVAAVHEDTLEEKDHEYDEVAEFNFLKHNRKVVKKNNKVVSRPRIKTRAH